MFDENSFSTDSFSTDAFLFGVAILASAAGVGKRKYVYVEKDDKIYLFNSASNAALWLEAQSIKEGTKQAAGAKKKRVPKPVNVIKLNTLKTAIKRIQTDYTIKDLERFKDEEMWDILLSLQAKLEQWQEDEDLIILLMAL